MLRVRRALDRGHLLPPRPRDGQRHRLRLHLRRRLARHDAALDRQHRRDRAGQARAARHGRGGQQPLHRRRHPHAPGRRHASRRSSATSTTWSSPPSRPASTPSVPASPFLAAHNAAMEVLAHGLEDIGLLPVSAEEALDPESKVYARWTLHGTSHMLGMDVHDCGRASVDIYPKGDLAEGMVLTVEPGLYFQEDDLLVPEELRGIGIRIEDDILVTADGSTEPLGLAPPHLGRRRGVDGPHRWLTGLARLRSSTGGLPPLRRLPLPLVHACSRSRAPASSPTRRRTRARWSTRRCGCRPSPASDVAVPQQGQDGGRRHRRRPDAGDPRPRLRRHRPARLRPALRPACTAALGRHRRLDPRRRAGAVRRRGADAASSSTCCSPSRPTAS